MVVTVFRSRVRTDLAPEVIGELERYGKRMAELATAMPGFVSYKDFAAADGETVTIVNFESHEHQQAWRDHPEHHAAQKWARAGVLMEYEVQVCEQVRVSRYAR